MAIPLRVDALQKLILKHCRSVDEETLPISVHGIWGELQALQRQGVEVLDLSEFKHYLRRIRNLPKLSDEEIRSFG